MPRSVVHAFTIAVLPIALWPGAASGQVLYFAQDSNPNGLFTINTVTGIATKVGAGITGLTGTANALSESANPAILFGGDSSGLHRINADGSGAVALGGPNMEGLAFDPTSGLLYGNADASFFTVNQATGAVLTNLASPGGDVEALAWVPGFIYGIVDSSNDLLRYNIATNTWTTVGNTGVNFDNMGLAYDPVANILYAVGDVGAGNNLYTINQVTGAATVVGPLLLPSGTGQGGLAFVPAGPPSPGAKPGSEGTYAGCNSVPIFGAAGSEGGFGRARGIPILLGPFLERPGGSNVPLRPGQPWAGASVRVFNVAPVGASQRQKAQADTQPSTAQEEFPGWILTAGIALGLMGVVALVRKLP